VVGDVDRNRIEVVVFRVGEGGDVVVLAERRENRAADVA